MSQTDIKTGLNFGRGSTKNQWMLEIQNMMANMMSNIMISNMMARFSMFSKTESK